MNGPRLGAHMSIAGGLEKAIARGIATGCETIQLFTKNASQWDAKPLGEADIAAFRAAAEAATDIHPLVCHDSYLINLASPEAAALKRSREAFLHEMQRCEALGIPYIVTHPGSHLGEGVETGLARIAESFDWLFERTPDYQLLVLLETTAGQGTNLGFTFEQLRTIIDKTARGDRFGICLDTCHIFTSGYDIRDEVSYHDTFQKFDDVIGLDRLKCIHVNDSKKDLGSRVDRHDHIGRGALGLETFRLLVNDERLWRVPMILETPKGEDNAEDIENLAVLRGLIGL